MLNLHFEEVNENECTHRKILKRDFNLRFPAISCAGKYNKNNDDKETIAQFSWQ